MPFKIRTWRPDTAYDNFYEKLLNDKFVTGKAYLFAIATVLGFMLKKRSAQNLPLESVSFYPLISYEDLKKYPIVMEFLNYVFDHYAQGTNEREKQKDIEKIADGGIEFLMEEYEKHDLGYLDLSLLIEKVVESIDDSKLSEK